MNSLIEEFFHKRAIEGVPEIIFNTCRTIPTGADDIAVIVLEPGKLFGITTRAEQIILCDTTALREK